MHCNAKQETQALQVIYNNRKNSSPNIEPWGTLISTTFIYNVTSISKRFMQTFHIEALMVKPQMVNNLIIEPLI